MNKIYLSDRKVIEISGNDSFEFLNGLVTNDILQLKDQNENLIYCVMLSPKGRFWYDFFAFSDSKNNKIYLDCLSLRAEEIVKKLSFYKLRSDVKVKIVEDIRVFWSCEKEIENKKSFSDKELFRFYQDPRSKKMGFRIYLSKIDINDLQTGLEKEYHKVRIFNKIPESEYDLTFDKSLILEFGFDNFNAISYEKGCYMGQELTARTHYTGQIRKKIFLIEIDNWQDFLSEDEFKKISKQANILKNTEITCNDVEIGVLLSSINDNEKIFALSLIKDPKDNVEDFEKSLKIKNSFIKIIKNANLPASC